jgi:hypothetical protein
VKRNGHSQASGGRPVVRLRGPLLEGRDGQIRIPPFHGEHFSLWTSSMRGVLRTALSKLPPVVLLDAMPLAQSGKCPLHDRFGRAADGTPDVRKSAQTRHD